MIAVLEDRTSRAAKWARRLDVFALVLLILSVLLHHADLVDTISLLWLFAIAGVLAVAGLVLAAIGFRRVWHFGDRGGRDLAVAIVAGLIVLAPFGVSAVRAYQYPVLDDISTDLVDPPAMPVAAANRAPGANPVRPIGKAAASLQIGAYPEVTGRRYGATPDVVLQAIKSVIAQRGWKVVSAPPFTEGEGEYTIEAVARTFLIGFRSDVAIRLTDEGETTYVDMRSASRYGRGDLGDNARRITSFLDALDNAMTQQSAN